ncbi:hypothetical protein ACFE04_024299 [Oxalis oulophora]
MELRVSHAIVRLLDKCVNFGSLLDGKKLHVSILKLGLDKDSFFSYKMMSIYIGLGDLVAARKVFDDMPIRTLPSWNKMLSALSSKNLNGQVCKLYSRMTAENVNPNESVFECVLRAFSGSHVAIDNVERIHARIICHGFGTSLIISNSLIDLYAKNSHVNTAKKVFRLLHSKDCVSWLAMISGLSRNSHEEEAISLFSDLRRMGIVPTPYVFSNVLSACKNIQLFNVGEQIHGLIVKIGFCSETYVCNALVTLYSRFGNFTSSVQIFSETQQRDAVTYNSLISGLGQHGHGARALDLFEEMQLDCKKPDCVTVASLLTACASIGELYKGKQLHSFAIKSGLTSDIFIEGSLLDLYMKCSDINTAREFFLSTNRENVVLWNVMLVAYGQLDDLTESFSIFRQMLAEGILPNQSTYPSILRTCTSSGDLEQGFQIHTHVIKSGLHLNGYVGSVLIDMYAKLGKPETAMEIFRRLSEKDVITWTSMIAGYMQNDLFINALGLFKEMLDRGIRPDNIVLANAISSCAGIQALNQGRQIHAQSCVYGFSYDLSIGNALINLYAKCGRIVEANLAFEKIGAKDKISWNGLLSGFSQSGYYEEALQIFAQMNKARVLPNLFTFPSTLSAAANTANFKLGKQIHGMIIKTGYDSETEISNALITFNSKCGSIDDAKRLFLDMPDKNEVTWNAIMGGCCQHGQGHEAFNFFEKMKQLGVRPNHITFVEVLTACSHAGLVNEGLACFDSMEKEHNLKPKPEHYACFVDLLCRAGLLSRAKEFVENMTVAPDAMIWRTLLSGCIIQKNMEIGKFAGHHLLKLAPKDSASYVLLSNLYAVTKEWECRDHTRLLMKNRGVKKEPGRSWIEVKNTIHAFYVGDRHHPLVDKIYEYLGELNKRVAEIGYVQDHNSLLNDAEQEQRDSTLCVHSEKLAIAFGLLSLSKIIPVLVMKNLRVCRDCHNWIKHVSKISDRAIKVRDNYRFHHFEGGVCSCGDFW